MDWTGSVTSDNAGKGSGDIDVTLANGATSRVSPLIRVFALKDRNIWRTDEWVDEATARNERCDRQTNKLKDCLPKDWHHHRHLTSAAKLAHLNLYRLKDKYVQRRSKCFYLTLWHAKLDTYSPTYKLPGVSHLATPARLSLRRAVPVNVYACSLRVKGEGYNDTSEYKALLPNAVSMIFPNYPAYIRSDIPPKTNEVASEKCSTKRERRCSRRRRIKWWHKLQWRHSLRSETLKPSDTDADPNGNQQLGYFILQTDWYRTVVGRH